MPRTIPTRVITAVRTADSIRVYVAHDPRASYSRSVIPTVTRNRTTWGHLTGGRPVLTGQIDHTLDPADSIRGERDAEKVTAALQQDRAVSVVVYDFA